MQYFCQFSAVKLSIAWNFYVNYYLLKITPLLRVRAQVEQFIVGSLNGWENHVFIMVHLWVADDEVSHIVELNILYISLNRFDALVDFSKDTHQSLKNKRGSRNVDFEFSCMDWLYQVWVIAKPKSQIFKGEFFKAPSQAKLGFYFFVEVARFLF